MLLDLKKNKSNLDLKLKKFSKIYDFIIIGTGPSASIILNNLIKLKKKILVVERGDFKNDGLESIKSNDFKIRKSSRIFRVGGTSNSWSQTYSYFSKDEMMNFKKKNLWPLSHKELVNWCKKIGPKYKFDKKKITQESVFKNRFYLRKFAEIKKPLRFSKFYKKKDFDMIINCKIESLDELGKFSLIFFNSFNRINSIKSKKIIICAGGIESSLIILNSLNEKKLKNLRNKKFVGRYFMDHPKCYVGEIKYPKIDLIKNIIFKSNKKFNSYYGISLYDKYNRLLNTYVRFEEKRFFFKLKKKIMIRIFLEMEPRYQNKIHIQNKIKKINISLSKKDLETSRRLLKKVTNFFSFKPQSEKLFLNKKKLVDASHHMGGMSFPKVVDKNLKIKGVKNIFCCSSAIFPSSGSVNPTFIICALAERLSSYLKKTNLDKI